MSRWRSKIGMKNLGFGALVLLALSVVACQDSGSSLVSLTVTPHEPNIARGSKQQFTAMGTFGNGSTQDLTPQVSWAAIDIAPAMGVATIDNNGMASGGQPGHSAISATYMNVTGNAVLTVTEATAVSMNVTPSNASIANGTSQQFVAKVVLTDGTTQDVSSLATWTISAQLGTNVLTIDKGGLAKGTGVGQATITATYMTASASANLTVTNAVITSINVTPSNPAIAKGTMQQFTATATFSDATTQDITQTATWTAMDVAPDANVATIGATGIAVGKNLGSATIMASFGGKSGTARLTITAAVLAMITVSPNAPSSAKGTTQQFTATATFTDATTQDITSTATWTAVDVAPAANVATITAAGLATAKSLGSATITATTGGKSGSATLTVTAAVVTSISVSPDKPSLAKGTSQQLTATATFSDATTQDVTAIALWTTTDVTGTGVASVDAAGLVTGKSVGTATITATYLGFKGDAALTVTPAVVTKVVVAPAAPSIAKGTAQQFTATATFSDATTQDVSTLAVWTTADVTGTGVVSIDTNGLATGTAVGTATITATYMGSSGNATLTVTPAVVNKIVVTPAAPSIAKGLMQQFTATATLSDATTQNVTAAAVWTTTDVTGTNVASINTAGLATGKNLGTATLTATYAGFNGSATLTVTAAVPVSINITPAPLNIPLNMVVQLTATLVNSDGTTLDVTATGAWDSATPAVATVTATGATGGRARGVAAGTAVISVTAKGITGQITATVSSCHVTINEVQAAGTGGAADEFVELYNSCTFAVDLNHTRLFYRSAAGTTDINLVLFDIATVIPAQGFLLYVGDQYPAASPRDGVLASPLAAAGAGIGVVYPLAYTTGAANLVVDSVGYGTATNIYVEGAVAAAPPSANSIRRKPDGTDTNKNNVDFTIATTPTPRATNG